MNPEEHNRIVNAGLSNFAHMKPKTPTATDLLVDKAKALTSAIRDHTKPVLKAGGWRDEDALRQLIARLYVEGFSKFSKEELENLCTMLHVELMIETIEAAPWGDDKPDLLSGQ